METNKAFMVARCTDASTTHGFFHFEGYYSGKKINQIVVSGPNMRSKIKPHEDYIVSLRNVSTVNAPIMRADLIMVRPAAVKLDNRS